jgi:hypothetical protein
MNELDVAGILKGLPAKDMRFVLCTRADERAVV